MGWVFLSKWFLEICSCPQEGMGVKRVISNLCGNRIIKANIAFKISVFPVKKWESCRYLGGVVA